MKELTNGRKFKKWQETVALQYGIEPAPLKQEKKTGHKKEKRRFNFQRENTVFPLERRRQFLI